MRRTRQFRPEGPAALEERVVLSHITPVAHHHAAHVKLVAPVKPTTPTPDNVIKGSVGSFHGLDMAQTVKSGQRVYADLTTNFADTTSQTESRLIVPDPSAGTVTTTKTVRLRNNQGQETVVDVATTKGPTTNHTITTTLPNGAMESETRTEFDQGSGKVLFKGTITLPGGSTETYTGTVTTSGDKQTTDVARVDAEGFTTNEHTVVTVHNELSQSTTSTTTYPDGTATTSTSNTSVLRLTPPSP